ncbi:MAG: hypothetical protein MUF49_28540 [Oculatellaceae cyanobacterium Prado106]|nr:hypothetical protein [Oculatellaceae cyanobacterium Prado106]
MQSACPIGQCDRPNRLTQNSLSLMLQPILQLAAPEFRLNTDRVNPPNQPLHLHPIAPPSPDQSF